jgi:hypothetical protein
VASSSIRYAAILNYVNLTVNISLPKIMLPRFIINGDKQVQSQTLLVPFVRKFVMGLRIMYVCGVED